MHYLFLQYNVDGGLNIDKGKENRNPWHLDRAGKNSIHWFDPRIKYLGKITPHLIFHPLHM